jgi:hypothetical protein
MQHASNEMGIVKGGGVYDEVLDERVVLNERLLQVGLPSLLKHRFLPGSFTCA